MISTARRETSSDGNPSSSASTGRALIWPPVASLIRACFDTSLSRGLGRGAPPRQRKISTPSRGLENRLRRSLRPLAPGVPGHTSQAPGRKPKDLGADTVSSNPRRRGFHAPRRRVPPRNCFYCKRTRFSSTLQYGNADASGSFLGQCVQSCNCVRTN